MVKGNFIGAAIVAIIYTVYILMNPGAIKSKPLLVIILVILNALIIVLLSFAFKGVK
jgi:nitrogen fixation/metabolism regulation signal transduction histidine kinase